MSEFRGQILAPDRARPVRGVRAAADFEAEVWERTKMASREGEKGGKSEAGARGGVSGNAKAS